MRPIDADELMNELNNSQTEGDNYYDGLGKAKSIVCDMSTIDVRPNIHAYWIPFEKEAYWFQDIEEIWETGKPTKQTQYRCSHCLAEFGTIVVEQNYIYCPKCNAKMDEEIGS